MTDYTKPISASNPPESKGTHPVIEEPLEKPAPKKAPLSKKSLEEPKGN